MNRLLQFAADRLRLDSLRRQVTLLFALLLTLSVSTYSLYTSFEQAGYVERLERNHADELARHLSAALEPHVADADHRGITAHLLEVANNASILRLTVTDLQGTPLASVHRSTGTAALTLRFVAVGSCRSLTLGPRVRPLKFSWNKTLPI